MTYPTYPAHAQIFRGEKDGYGYIFEGHGVPDPLIRSTLVFVGAWEYAEVWMDVKPRVKFCGRYGKPCNSHGRHWHPHWYACEPGEGQPYTMVWPEYKKESGWKRRIA